MRKRIPLFEDAKRCRQAPIASSSKELCFNIFTAKTFTVGGERIWTQTDVQTSGAPIFYCQKSLLHGDVAGMPRAGQGCLSMYTDGVGWVVGQCGENAWNADSIQPCWRMPVLALTCNYQTPNEESPDADMQLLNSRKNSYTQLISYPILQLGDSSLK